MYFLRSVILISFFLLSSAETVSANHILGDDCLFFFRSWLDNTWVIEEIKGVKINSEEASSEKSKVVINTESTSFSVFLGCNRMGGKVYVEDDHIKFYNAIVTKMNCKDAATELEYVKVLLSITHYGVIEDRLYLSNAEGLQMVLIRS